MTQPGEVTRAGNPTALLYPQVLMSQSYSYPGTPLPWEDSSCVNHLSALLRSRRLNALTDLRVDAKISFLTHTRVKSKGTAPTSKKSSALRYSQAQCQTGIFCRFSHRSSDTDLSLNILSDLTCVSSRGSQEPHGTWECPAIPLPSASDSFLASHRRFSISSDLTPQDAIIPHTCCSECPRETCPQAPQMPWG